MLRKHTARIQVCEGKPIQSMIQMTVDEILQNSVAGGGLHFPVTYNKNMRISPTLMSISARVL